jgi:hypothetical protein
MQGKNKFQDSRIPKFQTNHKSKYSNSKLFECWNFPNDIAADQAW